MIMNHIDCVSIMKRISYEPRYDVAVYHVRPIVRGGQEEHFTEKLLWLKLRITEREDGIFKIIRLFLGKRNPVIFGLIGRI